MIHRTWAERWMAYQTRHASQLAPYTYLLVALMSGLQLGGRHGQWAAFVCGVFLMAALVSWERLGSRRLLEQIRSNGAHQE